MSGERKPAKLAVPDALKRGIGSPALFGIVQGFVSASMYFVARRSSPRTRSASPGS